MSSVERGRTRWGQGAVLTLWTIQTPEACVRIEFRMPPHQVLLSDFDAWHCVLNDWYLALDEDEDADWQCRHPNDDQLTRSSICQAEVEASWHRIFDLELIRSSPEWGGPGAGHTQAVVAGVPLRSVRRVDHFTSRDAPIQPDGGFIDRLPEDFSGVYCGILYRLVKDHHAP